MSTSAGPGRPHMRRAQERPIRCGGTSASVIPAKAGIQHVFRWQRQNVIWIPASAGMTFSRVSPLLVIECERGHPQSIIA